MKNDNVTKREPLSTGKYECIDTWVSLDVVQCRQFDPVSGTFSMNNEHENSSTSTYSIDTTKNLVPIKSRDSYFKSKKKASNFPTIILAILTAILLITVIVLSVLYGKPSRTPSLCESEDCMRIAASLKESMDTSVDPCDDFYNYACGRWPLEHPTPDFSLTNSWFSERTSRTFRIIRDLLRNNFTSDVPWAVVQAKILYTSCNDLDSINSVGLEPLFSLLETLGLPFVPALFTNKTEDYVKQMANVKKNLWRDIFIGFDIYPDPRNKSRNVMTFERPTSGYSPLPSNKELEKRLQIVRARMRKIDENVEDVEEISSSAERTYMTDVIEEVLSNGTAKTCNSDLSTIIGDKEVKEVVDKVYRLTGALYFLLHDKNNKTTSDEEIQDEDYMLVDDLQRITDEYVMQMNSTLTPKKIWRPFLEILLNDTDDLDLNSRDKVLVTDLEYLKNLALLLTIVDEQTLETTIWWIVVDIVVPHSSENLRKAWSTYLTELMSGEVSESRSMYCAEAVNQLMGMAVSWLFVDPLFHDNKGPKLNEMLEDIRSAFASLVVRANWMDRRTKLVTLEKNNKMSSAIGHPKWLFEEGELDEYYKGIDLSENTYLNNMMQIVCLGSVYELMSLRDYNSPNEIHWTTEPTEVNAFHTFQANQITIPAGIVQFPFYELGLESLNYGAIGAILGHELTHGFDNSGRQYDSDGNIRQWWSNETIVEYTDKTQCFVEHYSSYYEDEVDDYIDGELTLGENIADNGGLREAVLAYRRWVARHGQEPLLPGFTYLTHEQLLFLGFAHLWCESYTSLSLKWMLMDSHCPGHVRLRGVLRNSEEFSKVWKCPVGSNMNPEKKCHLW